MDWLKNKCSSINRVNWSWTKKQKQYNRPKIVPSTDGAGTSGHPYAKKEEKRH